MEFADYLRFVLALGLVVVVILGLSMVMRRVGGGAMGLGRKGTKRLSVVEAAVIDPRRRLVLVRRDGVEHLLLVGGTTDVVVERGIAPPPSRSPAEGLAP